MALVVSQVSEGDKESDALTSKRNQSNRVLARDVQGGYFLRNKPLGILLPGYSHSGSAVGAS
jgi:hypothetical protein